MILKYLEQDVHLTEHEKNRIRRDYLLKKYFDEEKKSKLIKFIKNNDLKSCNTCAGEHHSE